MHEIGQADGSRPVPTHVTHRHVGEPAADPIEHQLDRVSVYSLDIESEAQVARATLERGGGERDMEFTGLSRPQPIIHQDQPVLRSEHRPRLSAVTDFQGSDRTRQGLVHANFTQSRGQTESQSSRRRPELVSVPTQTVGLGSSTYMGVALGYEHVGQHQVDPTHSVDRVASLVQAPPHRRQS